MREDDINLISELASAAEATGIGDSGFEIGDSGFGREERAPGIDD